MRWPPLLDWCTDPSCPKLGRENHAFLLKMEIFLTWQLFPKRNWNLHIASTNGSDSTEYWSKQDWHDMTAGNGFGWLQSSGLPWLALVQPFPPAPLVVAAKNEIETQTNLAWLCATSNCIFSWKKTIKLGESPLYDKMYTFSQKMWQSKCVKMLHDPLFTHFLTRRSRIGGQSLIFWESKRALALPVILCFPASVFYRQASNSLQYVFEAGTRYCAQGSRDLVI